MNTYIKYFLCHENVIEISISWGIDQLKNWPIFCRTSAIFPADFCFVTQPRFSDAVSSWFPKNLPKTKTKTLFLEHTWPAVCDKWIGLMGQKLVQSRVPNLVNRGIFHPNTNALLARKGCHLLISFEDIMSSTTKNTNLFCYYSLLNFWTRRGNTQHF